MQKGGREVKPHILQRSVSSHPQRICSDSERRALKSFMHSGACRGEGKKLTDTFSKDWNPHTMKRVGSDSDRRAAGAGAWWTQAGRENPSIVYNMSATRSDAVQLSLIRQSDIRGHETPHHQRRRLDSRSA